MVVYLPALAACCYLVNTDPNWRYDPGVVLDNADFNAVVAAIAAIGIVAAILAVRPNWVQLAKR